jgi:hypothetical protein
LARRVGLANAGIMAGVPVFWVLPTLYLRGAAAAAGIALINSLGNLSGFVTLTVVGWLDDRTGTASKFTTHNRT